MTGGNCEAMAIRDIYEDAFVRRSLELLSLGYRRLVPSSLTTLDETAITGQLCDAMEAALDAPERPDWATHFTTVDDQPESVSGRTGKRRPRMDVCVRCTDPRPQRRFHFEAKRLNKNRALATYLGQDGMLALIGGHYGDLKRAGMIGYVQSSSCNQWSNKIQQAIKTNAAQYYSCSPTAITPLDFVHCEPAFETDHANAPAAKRIIHTLLQCA